MHIDWAIAAAGAGVGFIVGLTGMGGGALMTPLLVLVFGINPSAAVASDLVAAVIMKPVGGAVHLRRGTVDMRLVRLLVVGSVSAAFLSVWLLSRLQDPEALDSVVKTSVGVALLLASTAMLAKSAFSKRPTVPGALGQLHLHPARTVAIGVFGGAVVGLTSVGSGSLMMVLLMLLYPTLASKELVGTDLVQAVPLVAAAAAAHLLFGNVELGLTTSLVVGAVPAVYLGARISSKAPDRIIRPILVAVLVVSGLKMLGASNEVVGTVALVMGALAASLIVRATRIAGTATLAVTGSELGSDPTLGAASAPA
ncbi:MAG: sulfite exporter TauE/SafE family protein [Acidimicrobiales bacterium]